MIFLLFHTLVLWKYWVLKYAMLNKKCELYRNQLQFFVDFRANILGLIFSKYCLKLRPNKKNKCVSGNGSDNFRYIFFLTIFFLVKKSNDMHFERHFAFQNA